MPKLTQEIIDNYETLFGRKVKSNNVPGLPGKVLAKSEEGSVKVRLDDYRSIVGKLLYLSTKLRPDIANAVRELSSHLSHPNDSHWDAVEKLVGYLKVNGEQKIEFHRPQTLSFIGFCDADWAKDSSRKSISGRIGTVGGMLVSWQSARQNCVTLSSTESEYVSLANCCQEAVFVRNLIKELTNFEKLAIVFEDNVGAIFLVKNQQVGPRTKHIDIRAHWIRGLSGQVKIDFVRSEDNVADILTKNLALKEFDKHASNIFKGNIVPQAIMVTIIGEDVKNSGRPRSDLVTTKVHPLISNNSKSNDAFVENIMDDAKWTVVSKDKKNKRNKG